VQKHLFFWWNIRVGKFLSKALFAVFCPLFVVEFRWRIVVYQINICRSPSCLLWNTMVLLSFIRISFTWQQPIWMPYSARRVEPLCLWSWILRWFYEHSSLSIIISPARSVEVLMSSSLLQDNSSTSDNGTISPVIQPTNQSRVPSSRPRTNVRPEGKDARSKRNTKWNGSESSHDVFYHDVVQSYGHVATRASHHDETCAPCKQSCQWRCRSHWKTWSYFYGSLMLITFKFVCKSICSFGETLE